MYEFQLGQQTNILRRESQIKSNWLIVQKVSEGVASIYSLQSMDSMILDRKPALQDMCVETHRTHLDFKRR
jgi:hypothetical protein